MANVLSLDTIEEFVFNTANVTIGDATLPGYAIKPTKAGILDFDQNGTSIARLEIDGNVEAVGLQLRASAAERVMISGGANTIAASTYPGAWVGDATGLISGVVDDARLVGDYSFGNIVTTGAVTANTVAGNLDAPLLTSGTMHNDRLDGTYAFNSLNANVIIAANAIGNINAINVTSGTLNDARLAGAYTFDTLELSGNVDATSGIGNVDASVVTTGVLSNDRLVGSYTIDAATTPVVDSDTVHVPSLEPNRVVVSDGPGVSSSATTATELGYINDTTGSIQTQLDDIHAGTITGSSLDNLVANNVTLGTLDDARLTGSYTFEHIVLTANQTASSISANANASHLTTGLIDPGRLAAADYDDVGILAILDSLVASVVDAVLDADDLVSGIVPNARMDGAYAFDSLELDTTANADWVHGAFDTSRLTTGEIPVGRFNFETVSSNVVSVGYRLGTESNRWDDVYANSATVDDIVIRPGGSVQSTQPSVVSMQLDLESTSSNIVASSASYTVGTPSIPWSNVYTTTAHVANSLIIVGNVTDPSGNSVGFDLENVDVALLPRYGDQWIGTNVRPWETIDASSLVVGDFGGNTITTALMSTNAATIGNESQPWSNVFASNITGSVDGVWVGDVWSQLDIFTGTIEALDGVTLKSEPVSFRFLPDETTGLGLVDGTTPGGVDVTVGGTVATRIINGTITQTGNVNPVGNTISSLGKPLFGYSDLHANAVYTPIGKLDDGVLVNTFDSVGNVSFGSWSVSDSVVAASFVGNANASSIVSGTVSDGLFGGSYTVSNLDVSGSFAIDGSLVCGDIVPTANATYDLGSTSNRFRDLYVSGSTITLGTASLSTVDGVVNISSDVVVTNGVSGSGLGAQLIASNVQIVDIGWDPIDDTAMALSGGYILLNGSGFAPSSIVKIGDTNAVATSYVSSTQLRVQAPAKSIGTYNVSVVRPDTKTATLPSALTYSDAVTWITSTSLGDVYHDTVAGAAAVNVTIQATSDSNVTYANTTSLPTGVALNSTTGGLVGNIITYSDTVYSFDVKATDLELQDATRTFILQHIGPTPLFTSDASQTFSYVTDTNSIKAWGINAHGQCGVNNTTTPITYTQIGTNGSLAGKRVIKAEYGFNHAVFLCSDGSVHTCGDNSTAVNGTGALGDGTTTDRLVPVNITNSGSLSGKTVNKISVVANWTTMALCSDGTLHAWGHFPYVGLGWSGSNSHSPVNISSSGSLSGKTIKDVFCGWDTTHVICTDNTIHAWAGNHRGQVGDGSTTYQGTPVEITTSGALNGRTVTYIATGGYVCGAICTDGSLVTWGTKQYGILCDGVDGGGVAAPTPTVRGNIGSLTGKTVKKIEFGSNHAIALCTDDTLHGWGYNAEGQVGDSSTTTRVSPILVTVSGSLSGKTVRDIVVGRLSSFAICTDGTVHGWGDYLANGSYSTQPVDITASL